MDPEDWIYACAHRLQRRWRRVDPMDIEALAAWLWRDERLRKMAPAAAAEEWLRPVASEDVQQLRARHSS